MSRLPSWALVLGLFALGIPALDEYNVTWDEALGDFFFGERYLSYFTSFDPAYLDFESDPYPAGRVPDLSVSPFRTRPWEYYPVANLLAAATSTVLSRWLGLLDPFDGFHALNLVLGAVFILVFFPFVASVYGRVTALTATLLLFLSPRIVCHTLANIKDIPEMIFFSLVLMVWYRAWENGSVRGILLSGFLWGLALGTKANALFLPFIPLLLFLLGGLPPAWLRRRRQLVLAVLGAGSAGLLTTLALWPYLWPAPLERGARHLAYLSGQVFQTRPESVASPVEAILFTTPIPFLVLFLVGLVPVLREAWGRQRRALLPVAWIAVVLGRLYLPNAINFDGVRHFLELFPALALVAGQGLAWLVEKLQVLTPRLPRRVLAGLVLALFLLPHAATVVRAHPFEIAYWNGLVGGLRGARERGKPQAGDYWGMSYRQGLEWINDNVPEGSVLAVPILQHAVALVAPQRLRRDIGLAAISSPARPDIDPRRIQRLKALARQRPVYVMFVVRADWTNELMRECLTRLDPVAAWNVDGAPILVIYRYPGASL